MLSLLFRLLILCLLAPPRGPSGGEVVRVAVASNVAEPLAELARRFEEQTGHRVTLSVGSTGKHYAQIVHGAPFDVFFAADVRRPALLEQEGRAVPGSRFTYAVGQLVLWSPRPGYVDTAGTVLAHGRFRYLAIANPRLAPYGRAAREVLQALGLWERLQGRLVRGEHIGQAYQFVRTGNAELGLVAYAQVRRPGAPVTGSYWVVPRALYTPIEQQAVLLKDRPAARAFLAYVRGPAARQLLRDYGYLMP